jgi:hypothetical protein
VSFCDLAVLSPGREGGEPRVDGSAAEVAALIGPTPLSALLSQDSPSQVELLGKACEVVVGAESGCIVSESTFDRGRRTPSLISAQRTRVGAS